MDKREATALQARLEELAEALGGRAPGAKGILVWMDALGECSIDAVKAALSDWPKKNTKMPSPADILKVCRERISVRLEEESRQNAHAAGFDIAKLADRGLTEVARAELAKIKLILDRPRPSPRAWADRVMESEKASLYARKLAAAAIDRAREVA